jgi:uncharacterized protein
MSDDALLKLGMDLFDKKEYFECHEVLEKLWLTQKEPEKQLTQGLIQIAVANYHLQNGNNLGARKLLVKGLKRLEAFRPQYSFIDVEKLVQTAQMQLANVN